MSKDITIQEGGTARTFTGVTKLKTAKTGGGSCYWVPEEETQLGHKSITADGTYYAATDGYYGFEYVVVNGITGKDPNADDDDDHNITVDPETGDLVNTRLPASIAITTEPDKTIYVDGETIDLTGLVVKAYYADGTEWGTVNFSELLYDPEFADVSAQTTERYVAGGVIAEVVYCTVPTNNMYRGEKLLGVYNGGMYNSTILKESVGIDAFTRWNGNVYANNISGSRTIYLTRSTNNGGWMHYFSSSSTTGVGNFVRCGEDSEHWCYLPLSTEDPTGKSVENMRHLLDGQIITVKWARPFDHKVLTDVFLITVVDAA